MNGSTLPAVKRALVAALQARPGLADVTVAYQAPENALALTNDSGVADAIWLESADAVLEVANIKAPPHEFDERYDVTVTVQSLRPQSDGTQEVTDQRCSEMLAEVIGVFAASNALIEKTSEFPFCLVEPGGWHPVEGVLSAGHGTRFEVSVHVHARLALS